MNYEKYSNLVGKHALFSPSSVCLIDKTDKDLFDTGLESIFQK